MNFRAVEEYHYELRARVVVHERVCTVGIEFWKFAL